MWSNLLLLTSEQLRDVGVDPSTRPVIMVRDGVPLYAWPEGDVMARHEIGEVWYLSGWDGSDTPRIIEG